MKTKKLRIAQIAPSGIPISQEQNKAIYSHIAHLVNYFADKNNSVTLYGHTDSKVRGEVKSSVFHYDDESKNLLAKYEQWGILSDCYLDAQKNKYDLIHSHMNIMTGFISRLEKNIPTLISIHSPIEDWMRPILSKHKDEKYISFSLTQRKQMPELNWYANIYHGVDTELFSYNDNPDDYILFLGRITKDKGVHLAIEACKNAGENLYIAGRSYATEGYWHEMIEPHINGTTIKYLGELSLEDKIPIIQKAKALIFPTQYQEAFGYVLIEAMSCGTPIIAFPNGSVPEIVKDGITGFLVKDTDEMVSAIKNIEKIDRAQVRKRAEQFFSLKKMIANYESVYYRVTQENSFKKDLESKRCEKENKVEKKD
jgi:glycosyltransferase involved in cell wall biosynthesis